MKNEKAYLKKLAMDSYTDDDFFYSKLKKSSKVKKVTKKPKGRDDYGDDFQVLLLKGYIYQYDKNPTQQIN